MTAKELGKRPAFPQVNSSVETPLHLKGMTLKQYYVAQILPMAFAETQRKVTVNDIVDSDEQTKYVERQIKNINIVVDLQLQLEADGYNKT